MKIKWLILTLILCSTGLTDAFSYLKPGDRAENFTLSTSTGESAPLFSDLAKVNVVVFLRPNQVHSKDVAAALAANVEPGMTSRPVRIVAVISDRYSSEEINTFVRESGLKMPILIDHQDNLVGYFWVILHPEVGVFDPSGILLDYRHFASVNFIDVVKAQIRYHLGEITKDELDAVINPVQDEINENRLKATRRLNLARTLLKRNMVERATEEVQKALAYDNTLASSHSFYAKILVIRGDRPNACGEFAIAIRLDPTDADGLEGIKDCSKQEP